MSVAVIKHEVATQGHVALYSRDATWRAAVTASLSEAGHSFGQAAQPEEVQRLLEAQRYDVLALQVHDEAEGGAIASALAGIRLPLHTILAGNANALPLRLERRAGGTFRYVPGDLTPAELSRLVDVSIISGAWDDAPSEDAVAENGASASLGEVDLHDVIDRAASSVLGRAHRKKQTFRSEVIGSGSAAFGDRKQLIQALTALLKITIAASPERAAIAAEAEARADEWLIRITSAREEKAGTSAPADAGAVHAVEILRDETKTLKNVSKLMRAQGGMLWVELQTTGLPAFALTVPLPAADNARPTGQVGENNEAAQAQTGPAHGVREGGGAGRR